MMKKMVLLLLALAAAAPGVRAEDAKPGDAKRGAGMVAMCVGCHGIVGYQASFPEVYKVPMIAGQNAKYIVSALTAYNKGDRKHPTMRSVAGSLTEQDMADLAAFYEAQGKEHPSAPVPAALATPAPEALKAKLAACVACHGANFSTPLDPSYPRLAGQHADYLFHALKAYQMDGNPHVGRANVVMRGQVMQEADGKKKMMFNSAELKQVAAWLATLPTELRTVPESRFR